jgi:phage shock protein PspC (stress-responsive transcriptional regulator)
MDRKLYRKENDKMIGGVASGLADYLNLDVTIVRIIFILLAIFGFSGVLIYIILWIVLPSKISPNPLTDYRVYEENVPTGTTSYTEAKTKKSGNGRKVAGLILIGLGLYFLFYEFNFIPYWFNLEKLWPLVLIIPGVMILSNYRKKETFEKTESTETDTKSTTSTTTTESPNTNTDEPII